MKCAIRFDLSSTVIILFQLKKKLKKTQNLGNGECYEKSLLNKKDVKFDFTSDMFYKIFCIFKNINFIIGTDFPKIQL